MKFKNIDKVLAMALNIHNAPINQMDTEMIQCSLCKTEFRVCLIDKGI